MFKRFKKITATLLILFIFSNSSLKATSFMVDSEENTETIETSITESSSDAVSESSEITSEDTQTMEEIKTTEIESMEITEISEITTNTVGKEKIKIVSFEDLETKRYVINENEMENLNFPSSLIAYDENQNPHVLQIKEWEKQPGFSNDKEFQLIPIFEDLEEYDISNVEIPVIYVEIKTLLLLNSVDSILIDTTAAPVSNEFFDINVSKVREEDYFEIVLKKDGNFLINQSFAGCIKTVENFDGSLTLNHVKIEADFTWNPVIDLVKDSKLNIILENGNQLFGGICLLKSDPSNKGRIYTTAPIEMHETAYLEINDGGKGGLNLKGISCISGYNLRTFVNNNMDWDNFIFPDHMPEYPDDGYQAGNLGEVVINGGIFNFLIGSTSNAITGGVVPQGMRINANETDAGTVIARNGNGGKITINGGILKALGGIFGGGSTNRSLNRITIGGDGGEFTMNGGVIENLFGIGGGTTTIRAENVNDTEVHGAKSGLIIINGGEINISGHIGAGNLTASEYGYNNHFHSGDNEKIVINGGKVIKTPQSSNNYTVFGGGLIWLEVNLLNNNNPYVKNTSLFGGDGGSIEVNGGEIIANLKEKSYPTLFGSGGVYCNAGFEGIEDCLFAGKQGTIAIKGGIVDAKMADGKFAGRGNIVHVVSGIQPVFHPVQDEEVFISGGSVLFENTKNSTNIAPFTGEYVNLENKEVALGILKDQEQIQSVFVKVEGSDTFKDFNIPHDHLNTSNLYLQLPINESHVVEVNKGGTKKYYYAKYHAEADENGSYFEFFNEPFVIADPMGKKYETETLSIRLSASDPAAKIYYTLDGKNPDRNSKLYNEAIVISGTVTLKAIAVLHEEDEVSNIPILETTYTYTNPSDNYTELQADPPGKTYTAEILKVFLNADKPYETIYYSLDGTRPNKSSEKYNKETGILIQGTKTLKALAIVNERTDLEKAPLLEEKYVYDRSYAVITADPPGKTYDSDQLKVRLNTDKPVEAIYYTLDGTVPTIHSLIYPPDSQLTITGSKVLKAIAIVDDITDITKAPMLTEIYISDQSGKGSVNDYADITPHVEVLNDGFKIKLSTNKSVQKIYYTLDGKDPTEQSLVYDKEIITDEKIVTIKAIAKVNDQTDLTKAPIMMAEYDERSEEEKNYARVKTDVIEYQEKYLKVTLKTLQPVQAIYYTLDGEQPNASSNVYKDEILIEGSKTLKAIAKVNNKTDMAKAPVLEVTLTHPDYDPDAENYANVSAEPTSTFFASNLEIQLMSDKPVQKIYYTLNGEDPTKSNSFVYDEFAKIIISETTTVKAKAYVNDLTDLSKAPLFEKTYRKEQSGGGGGNASSDDEEDENAYVTANPKGREFSSSDLTISLTTNRPVVAIYYTTNGQNPTKENSFVYDNHTKITIQDSTIIKARALVHTGANLSNAPLMVEEYKKSGETNQNTKDKYDKHYTVVQWKTISNSVKDGILTIALYTDLKAQTIYYTLDGSVPNLNSRIYKSPIEIRENTILKAIAIVDEKTDVTNAPITTQKFIHNDHLDDWETFVESTTDDVNENVQQETHSSSKGRDIDENTTEKKDISKPKTEEEKSNPKTGWDMKIIEYALICNLLLLVIVWKIFRFKFY